MQPARARSAPGVGLLYSLLLAWCAGGRSAAAAAAAPAKRSFGFRVQSRDFQPTFRRSLLRNSTMPLHGAVKDFGYFYATLYLGTPAKKFAVIVDTGSTMTYVPCSTCGSGCGPNHQDAAFDPEASSTASLISCSSPKCSCGSPRCGCAHQQCTYQRTYAEQSSSSGILLEDVLALHDGLPGAPIIFGCETRETGEIFSQRADGLFGLGNSDASVVNQLVKAGIIDNVFSLCFGMVEGDGALLLGDAEVPGSIDLMYTPLLTSQNFPFYYNVKLLSLSVDGQLLQVSQSLFDQGYGTVLDSGTTFTYMPTPVFRAFANAVESYALNKGLKRVPGPDKHYQDICFGGAPSHEDIEALSKVFPSMEIQFDQGTSLVLGPLNYLFVHTFNSGKYCLGVFDNEHAGTLLGGITFRNVLVRYDRANKRIGFGPAPCKELGAMQRPPCSFFATEGNSDLTAEDAAKDGDCTMEQLRQQQQETFEMEDDLLEQQDAAAEQQQQQQQQQQQKEAKDSSRHESTAPRRPPVDQPEVPEGQQQHGGEHRDAIKPAQQQQPQQQPAPGGQQVQAAQHVALPGHSGQHHAVAAAEGIVPGGSSTGGQESDGRISSLTVGLLVAVVSVLSLGVAVALLQPGTRDRIRSVFGGSRSYRTLQEDDQDPEGGLSASDAANRPTMELSSTRSEYSRGISTPTKLQRTASNSDDGAAGGLAGGTPLAAGSSPSRAVL